MKRSATAVCLLLLVFLIGLEGYGRAGSAWSDARYGEHTFTSFEKLPEANRRIDMKNIDYSLLHAAIFYETNRQRQMNGRKVFLHSPALEKAAEGHSADMVRLNFFSHGSPVPGKETMGKRLALVGITNAYSAENIATTFGIEYEGGRGVYSPVQNGGYFSYSYRGEPIKNHTYLGVARAVVTQWMHSPGHRANILNANYVYLGAGVAHYKNSRFYDMDEFKCTQNFSSIKGGGK